jgi:hypothetical protein
LGKGPKKKIGGERVERAKAKERKREKKILKSNAKLTSKFEYKTTLNPHHQTQMPIMV